MGIFTGLLTLPLAPVRGVVWVAEQVADEAQRQLYDEDQIRAELLQLELDAEEGTVSEAERARNEDELFERLAVAHMLRDQPARDAAGQPATGGADLARGWEEKTDG